MLEYKLSLSGVECAVTEWNPQASLTVFALHGWLDNLATFESLAANLPNLRLIAVDFPGHGHSQHIPEGMAYHFYDGIYLIHDLAEHFKQSKINLLGHSMGGALSLVFAASCPEKISGLVSIESLGPLTATPEQMREHFSDSIKQRAALKNKSKPVYDAFADALNARASASQIAHKPIEPIVERGLTKVEGGYTWQADSRLRVVSPLRLSETHLENLLEQIKIPVLVIEGEAGYLTGNELFQKRKNKIRQLDCKLVSGGHHVHLEEPEECAQIISQYFEQLVEN